MGLDVRIPLGMTILIVGGMMSILGIVTHGDAALYEKSLGVDLNLIWGCVIFIFGTIMLFVGKRQKWQGGPVSPRPWERSTTTTPHY